MASHDYDEMPFLAQAMDFKTDSGVDKIEREGRRARQNESSTHTHEWRLTDWQSCVSFIRAAILNWFMRHGKKNVLLGFIFVHFIHVFVSRFIATNSKFHFLECSGLTALLQAFLLLDKQVRCVWPIFRSTICFRFFSNSSRPNELNVRIDCDGNPE